MTLSVLISVYAEDDTGHLERALESVWDEQHRKPDQIVLVKDGPLTRELDEIVEEWCGKLGYVLTVVPLSQNVGLAGALNEGLAYCRNDLVARMDSDDISLPNRFERQVQFMASNPDVSVSSAWVEEFDEEFVAARSVRYVPESHQYIAQFAIRRNPISHPVTIFRRQAVMSVGGYPNFKRSQDYALWALMLHAGHKMANLQEVLLRMRAGPGLMERRGLNYLKHEIALLRYQKEIGFLNRKDFFINMMIRAAIRVQPAAVKKLLYKFAR